MAQRNLADYVNHTAAVVEITRVLQSLIDEATDNGGVVSVSPGRWEVTTILLGSNMTLRIERGATLVTHADLSNYPTPVEDTGPGSRGAYHTILANGCRNLTIEGDGAFDGQGKEFWDEPHGSPADGAVGMFWRKRDKRVSPLLEFRNCQNLILRDFTIRNSPGWTVHLLSVDKARITALTLRNSLFGPNTDGLDINGCRDVFIRDCDLRCGDDAIILKAFPDAGPCENVVVNNCIMETNCAAVGFGAETSADIRNVSVSNCVVKAAIRMIQFEMWDPGVIENITITSISGRTMAPVPLERPIYMDIQHHGRTDGILGKIRNVVISNVVAETRGRIMLTAADGTAIENVTLRDIHLRYREIEDPELTVNRMQSEQMSNDSPETRDRRAAVIADNVCGLELINIQTDWPEEDVPVEEVEDGPWPGLYRNLPMDALLCRNVRQALIDSPRLRPNLTGQALRQENSDLTIRALDATDQG